MNGLPTVLTRRDEAGRTELDIEISAGNPWFEGHFPDFALLPGVVQIGWAAHFGHALFALGPEVLAMEQIKFKRPILPGSRLILALKPDPTARKLRYEFRDAEQIYSSGTLQFSAGPAS